MTEHTRRQALGALGSGAVALAATPVLAQSQAAAPRSTITEPRRDFGPGAAPNVYFWDPDLVAAEDGFWGVMQPNAAIERLWTGARWAEGPAWNSVGKFLIWSDIPENRQMRWLDDDGHVSEFRMPSGNSNGNTFDRSGRQLSAEHLTRRVVRYEHDGSVTILADAFEGKRFNSPNDVVEHPDGSVWFTDPPYGGQLYEGAPDVSGGPSNPDGLLNPRLGQPPEIGSYRREMETGTYRVAEDSTVTRVATEADAPDPNGLCFSPDHSVLYVASTGKGPGDQGPGGEGQIIAFDVQDDNTLSNRRVFTDCVIDGVKCGPDGLRCDVAGNVWASSNAGREVGYSGVTVWSPDGKQLGRIRLPEVCGNICFGSPKRNRLFMAASQSIYAIYTGTQGAGPA